MDLDAFTKIWMAGVIGFGVVFYMFAMRYAKHCEVDNEENKND
ncbi:hypothetical protein [Vibrio rarus]|nr:hypothetical protein [Vibrio rarus]